MKALADELRAASLFLARVIEKHLRGSERARSSMYSQEPFARACERFNAAADALGRRGERYSVSWLWVNADDDELLEIMRGLRGVPSTEVQELGRGVRRIALVYEGEALS